MLFAAREREDGWKKLGKKSRVVKKMPRQKIPRKEGMTKTFPAVHRIMIPIPFNQKPVTPCSRAIVSRYLVYSMLPRIPRLFYAGEISTSPISKRTGIVFLARRNPPNALFLPAKFQTVRSYILSF